MSKNITAPITFIIPDVNAFQSGGNIYNKHLIEGLIQCGCTPQVLSLTAFKALNPKTLKGHYFFDTLYFTQLNNLFHLRHKNSQFFLIVHHLESLYPPKGYTQDTYFQEKEFPFLKQYDGFLTSSQFTANYLTTKHLFQPKIVISPAITYTPKQISPKKAAPINALMVANLVERKGVLPFLKKLANPILINENKNLTIHIVGSDKIETNYARKCLSIINDTPTSNQIVQYHGQLAPFQLKPFFENANLFISTALMETYGMALQEARAFKLPILALDGGNIASHIESGINGFVFDKLDGLIQQLMQFTEQPVLLEQLLSNINTLNKADGYDWKSAAQLLLKGLE